MKIVYFIIILYLSIWNCCFGADIPDNESIQPVLSSGSDVRSEASNREVYDIDNESQIHRLQVEVCVQQADILLLTDGDSVEGVITKKTEDEVEIETAFGLKTYDMLDIDFVEEIDDFHRKQLLWKLKILTEYNKKREELESKRKISSTSKKEKPTPAPEDRKSLIHTLQTQIAVQQADILMLKNGDTIEGVIRETTDDIVSIETQYGLKIFERDKIEFVEQISEKDRFDLLEKLEKLHRLLSDEEKQNLEHQKQKLVIEQEKAKKSKQSLDELTGGNESDLFSLTNRRLEEIVKEFSQFPPNYWRYYHRKSDALKTILRLKRLRRYAHPSHRITINLYIKAFDYKIKEKGESRGSLLLRQYADKYESFFRSAEKRRSALLNTN